MVSVLHQSYAFSDGIFPCCHLALLITRLNSSTFSTLSGKVLKLPEIAKQKASKIHWNESKNVFSNSPVDVFLHILSHFNFHEFHRLHKLLISLVSGSRSWIFWNKIRSTMPSVEVLPYSTYRQEYHVQLTLGQKGGEFRPEINPFLASRLPPLCLLLSPNNKVRLRTGP